MRDAIARTLDLPVVARDGVPVPVAASPALAAGAADGDFEMARQNLVDLIETTRVAIAALSNVADQSQHPRAYEVLNQLINTMMKAQQDLLELRSRHRDVTGESGTKAPASDVVNNNLFVGSTAELGRALESLSASKKDA